MSFDPNRYNAPPRLDAAYAPPQFEYTQTQKPPPSWQKKLGPIGTLLVFLGAKLKSILLLLKAVPFLAKFIVTGGTMFASMWFYSTIFGWKFAAGFVIGILVHELGHVVAAKVQGVKVTAPIFIPGMGALIGLKENANSAHGDAIIGIGGPIGGTLAGLGFLALYMVFPSPLWLGLAMFTFWINLFNLTPMYPLDGGRIVGAISPYLWALGLVIMLGMLLTGFLTNPIIFLLILMGLPRLWHGFKTGQTNLPGQMPSTPAQRIGMGAAFVGLVCFLLLAQFATEQSLYRADPRLQRHAQVQYDDRQLTRQPAFSQPGDNGGSDQGDF
ncbi:MAG: hypothetical protein JSS72_08325 [Armatimonadetes bacterium]|nr:hypothetical protein [Armatimonadota bacterium]